MEPKLPNRENPPSNSPPERRTSRSPPRSNDQNLDRLARSALESNLNPNELPLALPAAKSPEADRKERAEALSSESPDIEEMTAAALNDLEASSPDESSAPSSRPERDRLNESLLTLSDT